MNKTPLTDRPELDILLRAKAHIEKGWCRNAYACDDDNVPVPFDFPRASRYCMLGAVIKEIGRHLGLGYNDMQKEGHITFMPLYQKCTTPLTHAVQERSGMLAPHFYNDHPDTTQADVVEVFEKAIEKVLSCEPVTTG